MGGDESAYDGGLAAELSLRAVHVRARGLNGKVKEEGANREKGPSLCSNEGRGPVKESAPGLENDSVGHPKTSGIWWRRRRGRRV